MSEQVWMTANGDLFLLKGKESIRKTDIKGVLLRSVFEGDPKHIKLALKLSGCTYLGEL